MCAVVARAVVAPRAGRRARRPPRGRSRRPGGAAAGAPRATDRCTPPAASWRRRRSGRRCGPGGRRCRGRRSRPRRRSSRPRRAGARRARRCVPRRRGRGSVSRSSSIPAGSSPFIGSSRISSSGSAIRQAAMPSRCRMPIEYLATRSSARSRGRRARARRRCARAPPARAQRRAPRGSGDQSCARGSEARRRSRRPARAPGARCAGKGRPSSFIVPAVGLVSPSSIRISVVLPAPFGPR